MFCRQKRLPSLFLLAYQFFSPRTDACLGTTFHVRLCHDPCDMAPDPSTTSANFLDLATLSILRRSMYTFVVKRAT